MPTYVYRCEHCAHTFEVRQRMADNPLTDCPNCDAGEVRRVINSVGIVFKGSGFYVTDNRNGKNGSVSSNGSAGPEDTGKKAETKSDSSVAKTKSSDSTPAKVEKAAKKD